MNQEVKKLWLEKLRSGQFRKGKHVLRVANCCCFMGVLCEVAVDKGIVMLSPYLQDYVRISESGTEEKYEAKAYRTRPETVDMLQFQMAPYDCMILPPTEVMEWAELKLDQGIIYNGREYWIGQLNDKTDLTFEEFADLVEKQL